jgi:hypothetical protein
MLRFKQYTESQASDAATNRLRKAPVADYKPGKVTYEANKINGYWRLSRSDYDDLPKSLDKRFDSKEEAEQAVIDKGYTLG